MTPREIKHKRERERFREMISMANRVENEATHQQQQQCSGKEEKENRHVLDSLVTIIAILLLPYQLIANTL